MDTQQQQPANTVKAPQLNQLCDICRSCFPSDELWPWDVSCPELSPASVLDGITLRQSSLMQLDDSARAGCHLCTLLQEAILPQRAVMGLPQDPEWMKKTMLRIHMLPDDGGFFVLSIKVGNIGDEGTKDVHLKRIVPFTDHDSNRKAWTLNEPGFSTRIDILQSAESKSFNPLAIQQIKNWLRICTTEHVVCRGPDRAMTFPKNSKFRLVDVGAGVHGKIHLIDVESNQVPGLPYMTLSYRWTAETKDTSLKKGNKDEFHKSIPTQAWPQTYQDAVSITRELGVRYLWIDSLCIVQDQPDDWDQQASLMDSIYSGGLLNLAGVEGERSSGLDVSRNPLRIAPCLLPRIRGGPDGGAEDWGCYRPDDIRKAVDRAQLYQRGWTFRERVLSRRTVHFGDQLFWECDCLRASETFPLGTDHPDHPESVDHGVHKIKSSLQVPAENTNASTSDEDMLHRLWCTVVRCYSGMELTKASDRLIALRGIVNSMARRFDVPTADYLAGLWKPRLPQQLMWARQSECISPADRKQDCLLENHFPSWTWASCAGEVRCIVLYSKLSQWFIRLQSAHAAEDNARTSNPSHLILRGRIIPWKPMDHQIAKDNSCLKFLSASWIFDGVGKMMLEVDIELDRPPPDMCSEVYLLPVLQNLGGDIFGLVLNMKGARTGIEVYRRIGYFHCDPAPLKRFVAPGSIGLAPQLETILSTLHPFILL